MADAPHSPESNTASPAAVVPVHNNAREAIIHSKRDGRFDTMAFAGQVGNTTPVAAVKGSTARVSFTSPRSAIRGTSARRGFLAEPKRAGGHGAPVSPPSR